jgi:hypothetical protein
LRCLLFKTRGEVRNGRSKILLQFRDGHFLFLYLAGLFLDFFVLFEELVGGADSESA